MSTIAEHLAALEFYRANRHTSEHGYQPQVANTAMQEAFLFFDVHLDELIAERSPEEMRLARLAVERVAKDNMPAAIAAFMVSVYREVLAGVRLVDGYKKPLKDGGEG